ncbi:hypothetical protein [Oceaniferula spumae]|uniref:hypothetical protein n=1 Tax=Oceaniferula spumae TaxID=2979115 RepID=UPI003F4F349E
MNIPKGTDAARAKKVSHQSIAPVPRSKKEPRPIAARPLEQAPPAPEKDKPSMPAAKAATSASSGSTGRRRVRHKGAGEMAEPDWEQAPSSSSHKHSEESSPLLWIVGGSLLGLSVVGIGAWLVIGSMNKDRTAVTETAEQWVPEETTLTTGDEEVELTEDEKKTQREIQDSIDAGVNVLTQAEEVVTKFLSAKTVEELEPLVRFPDVAMPKIRKWYQTHPLEPIAVKTVGYGGRVTVKGDMASLAVQLDDYSVRQIALERTPSGYRVDWESWVSWTEMDWEDLFTKRPVEPKEVRVRCSVDTYYNRDFNDDTKWLAVKLINTESDRTLYGYVDRDDPSLMRFVGDLGAGSTAATLKIRYPKDAAADNQVIITEHVMNGWVTPAKSEKSTTDQKSNTP